MPYRQDCHCKHCSTIIYKRAKDHLPHSQPQSPRQTARVLKISASDIFPILKVPSRVVRSIAGIMPALIRIEKTDGPTRKYERGWNYVETRNGRLCMVRNKKDGFDLHRGGWMKTKPRERIVREVLLVEPDTEPAHHRPVDHRDGRVIINLRTPRHYRGESSDDSLQHISRPRIQVRRPITAPASTTYQIYEPRHHHPHYHYVDEIESQLVQKTPVQRAQFHRYRREPITEEDTYCKEHQYDYDDCFETTNMPTREPRPYHHSSEEENSYWDDDLDAWMVDRKPKVRFE